jgi:hypothetical protein
MKHARFELSSEQTLRLEALRNTLAEALPEDLGGTATFPVAHYGCGCGCSINYYYTCATSCFGSCSGTCKGGCNGICQIAQ